MLLNKINAQVWFKPIWIICYWLTCLCLNVYAATAEVKNESLEPSVYFQESLSTTNTYVAEGKGVGMDGVSVLQPHRSVIHSTMTSGATVENSKGFPTLTVITLGKNRTVDTVAGRVVNQRQEVRTSFAIISPLPQLQLLLNSAEVLEVRGEYQLKIQVAFRNLTDKPIRITNRSFKKGNFISSETDDRGEILSVTAATTKLGTLVYQLPKVTAGYTLQVPTDTPFNSNP